MITALCTTFGGKRATPDSQTTPDAMVEALDKTAAVTEMGGERGGIARPSD